MLNPIKDKVNKLWLFTLLIPSYLHSFFLKKTWKYRRKKAPPRFTVDVYNEESDWNFSWNYVYTDEEGNKILGDKDHFYDEMNSRYQLEISPFINPIYVSATIAPSKITGGIGNLCPWLLQLDQNKVQEIDIVEFMHEKLYFSIYNNEESSAYFDSKGRPIYRRFQVKFKPPKDFNMKDFHTYSIVWHPNKVEWYLDYVKIAVSYRYIPSQHLYLVLTGLDKGKVKNYVIGEYHE